MRAQLLAALCATLLSGPLIAQSLPESAPPRPVRAWKLGSNTREGASLGYERQRGRYSLHASLGYWTSSYRSRATVLMTDSGAVDIRPAHSARQHSLGLTLQLRRYLQASKPALIGWYVSGGGQVWAATTRYQYANQTHQTELNHSQLLQLRLGRQFQLGRRFTFDLNLGPDLDLILQRQYAYNSASGQYTRSGPRYFGAQLTGGSALLFGYRF